MLVDEAFLELVAIGLLRGCNYLFLGEDVRLVTWRVNLVFSGNRVFDACFTLLLIHHQIGAHLLYCSVVHWFG